VQTSSKKIVAVILLCSFAAFVAAKKKADTTDAQTQQKQALHALDRLTFGPRPGDVQTVMAMGVDKWMELQLHPDKIDNAALDAKLAPYRTLHMSAREMAMNFPPPQVLKAVQDGKLPMPNDAYRRAIYSAGLVRLEEKKEAKQQDSASLTNVADKGGAAPNTNSGSSPRPADPDMQDQPSRRERRSQVEQLALLDPPARMQRILALSPAEQSDLMKGLPEPARQALITGLSAEQRETVLAISRQPAAVVDGELQSAKILRAVYSDRQLEEVLTDFWFNHFNVFLGKGADRYLVTSYERDVIRPHVLGKFKDLLVATAQSPAMLFYLDNWQSEGPHSDAALGIKENVAHNQPVRWRNGPFGPHPVIYQPRPRPQAGSNPNPQQKKRSGLNENYARELMELHTLGVNGGYSQQDVTEVARVFTGWTLQEPRDGGGFVFKPRLHEPGTKMVLGHKIKESGEKEGIEVLEILAHSPATAKFISTKLAERFVSDKPPQSLIDAMSKTFLKTDGDLREVMRTMFRSQEFWAPESYNAKVKTPLEFVASSLRATQADVTDPLPLIAALNQMGMPLYGMQPPTGYSTLADVWVNSAALLARMNFALGLVSNKIYGTSFDLTKLTGNTVATAVDSDSYQVQLKLEQVLLDGSVSAQTHRTIQEKVSTPGALDASAPNSPNAIAALLLGSPEFQRH
jgi:uncharacterized protein (DUF1800 family)